MMVRIVIGKLLVNVISGYAPQVGRSDEENMFWCAMEKLMENVIDEDVVVVGGDLPHGRRGKCDLGLSMCF